MDMKSRKQYLELMRSKYKVEMIRKKRSLIINEVVSTLGLHRKDAIRRLNSTRIFDRRRKVYRKVIYGQDLVPHLIIIWKVLGNPCSKRLKPNISKTIDNLKRFKRISLTETQEFLLGKMSTYTIDSLLKSERRILYGGKGRSLTRSSPLLKTLIPIRTTFEDIKTEGHTEIDTVFNCGRTVEGKFAMTLNVLDIFTHWSARKCFVGKESRKVIASFHMIRDKFPYRIKSVDFDNRDEFITWKFKAYCDKNKIEYTRSRPYKKNDQARIEGKNFVSVRKVTGYRRIEKQLIVDLMNDIFDDEHFLLVNFFEPTMKLKSMKKIGGKYKKIYEVAETPLSRVLKLKSISEKKKKELRTAYENIDLYELRKNYERKLEIFNELARQYER